MTILIAEGRDSEIEILDWRVCTQPLRLKSNGNPTLLARELGKAGISIFLNKNLKYSVMETVYAYLRAKAEVITLWPCFGWNVNSKGVWHFSDEKEVVFDDYT